MAEGRGSGYAFPEFLASTDWLADHLEDPDLRAVDTDVAAAYQRGHIPGAVMVPDNYEKDSTTGSVHILPPERFARMMEALGIGDDTVVVAYDNSRSLYAGRLWWAMRYYGHEKVKVLNGGWRKWVREGRPISIDPAPDRHGAKFTAVPDPSLMATTEELKGLYDRPGTVVWDVRSRAEYTGENPRHNRRPGHIPGASHLEWLEMLDQQTHTFKPAGEMRRLLQAKGITPEKEVVAH
jgi:thiosulfate/3-mercaptopyruvate sulfurtransferase